jgi:hypothetical protein
VAGPLVTPGVSQFPISQSSAALLNLARQEPCQGLTSPAAKSAKSVSACCEAQWPAPSSPQAHSRLDSDSFSLAVFFSPLSHPPLPPPTHLSTTTSSTTIAMAKCYDRYGNEDITRYPCSQDEDPAQCCGVGELCASNGLCVRLEDDSDPTYWQNTCSVSDWIDGDVDSCPTQCAEIRSTAPLLSVFWRLKRGFVLTYS